jgi:hypothetical protein
MLVAGGRQVGSDEADILTVSNLDVDIGTYPSAEKVVPKVFGRTEGHS